MKATNPEAEREAQRKEGLGRLNDAEKPKVFKDLYCVFCDRRGMQMKMDKKDRPYLTCDSCKTRVFGPVLAIENYARKNKGKK